MSNVFFIIGFVRSGTTAIARILDTASNTKVHIEQSPKLLIESRNLLKGTLADPSETLWSAKRLPINQILSQGYKYGDKNISYMPFIPYLIDLWDCKIVFVVRDGRDAVRSLIDWHALRAHNIFVMNEDHPNASIINPEEDPWDYSRLRPNDGDPLFDEWKSLSRFQKCAWYWENFNSIALDKLSKINPAKWMMVDVTKSNVETIKTVFEFLNLASFDPETVELLLKSRINSVKDRVGKPDQYPRWQDWEPQKKQEFKKLAGKMMCRLGYW